jgi:hypothetical protein
MRREYRGGARAATLTQPLGGSTADQTIFCDNLANWPTGVNNRPFFVVVGRNTPLEEKILCSSRSGNVITVFNQGTVNGRGADDTNLATHPTGAVIEHIFTATDANEANAHINNPDIHGSGAKGAAGNLLFWENDKTVTASYTITANKNAGTFGPVTINSGVTVTIPAGSTWSVV